MAENPALAFEEEVRNLLDQATEQTGYSFSGALNFIDKVGAVKAAKVFVGPASTGLFNDGFKVLVREKLSHLTVEQAVINFKDSGLFSHDEVKSAIGRIAMGKMLFDKE